MAIPRGSTPTHIFEIPIEAALVKEARITYAQNDIVVLTKETEDCTITGNEVITKLTQEDTFLFDDAVPVQMQLRLIDMNDDAYVSEVFTVSVKKCLDKEVLE